MSDHNTDGTSEHDSDDKEALEAMLEVMQEKDRESTERTHSEEENPISTEFKEVTADELFDHCAVELREE